MKATRFVLACSILASLVTGCYARVEPAHGTVVRETRSCDRYYHWDGSRCVENRDHWR
jgi:hypothetical protein